MRRPLLLFALLCGAGLPGPGPAQGSPPNIVLILADDLGYGDTGPYGVPDARTPHLDRLAAEGLKFTQFYSMGPECTPSRTSILTGRYPQRAGGLECAIGTGNVGRYDDAVALAERRELGLPPRLAVLAPGLKRAGYVTAAFGKWHLGYEPKFHPLDQGFDAFTGFLGGNVDYFRHVEQSDLPVYLQGRQAVRREGYLTHLITRDAVAFLDERAREPERPFFLYLPHAAPHFPFQGPKDDLGRLPTQAEWNTGTRPRFVSLLEDLDAAVGGVLAALEKNGQAANTVVVFASDNGAQPPGRNAPWRDHKGTLFEGGIRVPCLVRWPGVFAPGTVSHRVGTLMDLTASLLRLAGAAAPDGKPLDGIDILKREADGAPETPRPLFWRYRRETVTWWAVRDGRWKLVRKADGDRVEDWLFDLSADAAESRSLVSARPADYGRLQRALLEWERDTVPMR